MVGIKLLFDQGDHQQLPPVVKHSALRQFSHLDQSLFTRFVRLGVPSILLDRQGRARPEIAALYSWKYKMVSTTGDQSLVRIVLRSMTCDMWSG